MQCVTVPGYRVDITAQREENRFEIMYICFNYHTTLIVIRIGHRGSCHKCFKIVKRTVDIFLIFTCRNYLLLYTTSVYNFLIIISWREDWALAKSHLSKKAFLQTNDSVAKYYYWNILTEQLSQKLRIIIKKMENDSQQPGEKRTKLTHFTVLMQMNRNPALKTLLHCRRFEIVIINDKVIFRITVIKNSIHFNNILAETKH